MKWWDRLLGRSEQRATLKEVDFWLRDGLIDSVASGVSVTPYTALQVPDIYACISVLSQDVGRCPLKLRALKDDGEWVDATDHQLWEILHDLPNPEMTAGEFRSDMMRSLLAHEAAYAEIVRNPNGTIKAMWPLDSTRMKVERDALNVKTYTYSRGDVNKPLVWKFNPDRPPLLELKHPSPIHRCRDMVGLAIALDRYAGKFFANGARLSGLLNSPTTLTPDQRTLIRQMFESLHKGVENAHKVGVTEGPLTFTPMTTPNNEAQFNETRKHVRTMIAGAWRVPPHKIGDLERATFSNIEAQDRDYVNSSLNPYLVMWEQALRRDVLTTRQYPKYQVIFDREALIEADSKSRSEALAIGRQNGWWSANDVRRKLNENPIPVAEGGNQYHMNGNMIPLTGNPELSPDDPLRSLDPAGDARIREQVN
jgi:HK97 family phage portal protein